LIPLNNVLKEILKADFIVVVVVSISLLICVCMGAFDFAKQILIGLMSFIGGRGVTHSEKANGNGK
jgi:hypothetical protein